MLIERFLSTKKEITPASSGQPLEDHSWRYGMRTSSGERVDITAAMSVATAYRAKNIISDDVAKLPFQVFRRNGRLIEQVKADPVTRNMAYLLQVSPNIWGWTPFHFKKASIEWLLFHGNNYIWSPTEGPRQLLILPANKTTPVFDLDGNLWYRHLFSNSVPAYIPAVEILHTMINPDETGFIGRGVIAYARETIGRQLAARKTQSMMYSQGFLPAAYVQMAGELNNEARIKVRDSYEATMSGASNAYRLAVFDDKVTKFESINMPLKDAQFLESIDATDRDICNFFGLPEYKLNRGKEAYSSNEQKNDDYLQGTLDSFLVPWEEGARVRWLSQKEQTDTYFRFIRDALLRMDAKTRAETNEIRIRSGQMTPNQGREKEDWSAYDEGDRYYMAGNIMPIGAPANEN
jgi:HK97 family phage portal protein